jgi:hypothetical protein
MTDVESFELYIKLSKNDIVPPFIKDNYNISNKIALLELRFFLLYNEQYLINETTIYKMEIIHDDIAGFQYANYETTNKINNLIKYPT